MERVFGDEKHNFMVDVETVLLDLDVVSERGLEGGTSWRYTSSVGIRFLSGP